MKLFTVVILIFAFLASSSLALPYHHDSYDDHECDYEYCELNFAKPKEGIIYKINSTQTMEVTNLNDCYDPCTYLNFFIKNTSISFLLNFFLYFETLDKKSTVTYEIFSIGQKKVVQTIAEQEPVS